MIMLVDFIIPTFSRINELRSMLSSLVAQTDGDWQAQVIVDDTQNDAILSLAGSFRDNRIKVSFMDKRYNDWGHTPREWGKNQVVVFVVRLIHVVQIARRWHAASIQRRVQF